MGSSAYDAYVLGEHREPLELVVAIVDPVDVYVRLAKAGLTVEEGTDVFHVKGDAAPGGTCQVSTCWSAPGFEVPTGGDLTTEEQQAAAATRRVSLH